MARSTVPEAEKKARARDAAAVAARALGGGRVTVDQNQWAFGGFAPFAVQSPRDPDGKWRTLDLDAEAMTKLSPADLMELLSDISPEVSKGLWDFIRMCNPGWDAKCLLDNDDVDDAAQEKLDEFIDHLRNRYGSADIVYNRLIMASWLRGAFVGELVLNKAGKLPIDIATPDPHQFRFRKVTDPEYGETWRLCQWQDGTLVDLADIETIRYIPIDPFPGDPYGRPIAQAGLFVGVFLLGLLHDLRRVVAQQGYPRLDISLELEKVKEIVAEQLDGQYDIQDKEFWEAIDQALVQVQDAYRGLQPDEAFVHWDSTTINKPVGAISGDALGSVDGLIKGVERMLVRALKSIPLQLGITDAVSEANANRQWEMLVAGIKSIQHLVESALEHWFTLALEAQGINTKVEFRFAELRASEEMRDEQVLSQRIKNQKEMRDLGWITNDDASVATTGHEAAEDMPEPEPVDATPDPELEELDQEDVVADPGADRGITRDLLREVRTLIHVLNPNLPREEVA